MDFGALPPEINSARMYSGAGAGPLLSASFAWDGLATELRAAASAYDAVIAGLTSGPWLGPAAISAVSAATPYAVWMSATATQAEEAADQARAAVAAYEAAYAMTVPPGVVAANRVLLATMVATNFFGQNSPAIAAIEAHYSEMWAQDAAAMYGYAAGSASASALTPFQAPPQVTNPAGTAAQAAAVSQATGEAAATQSKLASLVNSLPTALRDMSTPASLTGAPTAATTAIPFGSSSGDMANYMNIATMPLFALSSLLSIAQTMQGMAATAAQQAAEAAVGAAEAAAGAAASGAEAAGAGVLGAMGQAASLGSLSVPASWTSVIPTAHLTGISSALPGGAGANGVAGLPPGLVGGMPRGVASQGPGPGPRYGLVPTVMAQPPSAGYGTV